MSNIVDKINEFRVEEKNGLFVQFFDKKRQKTNEDLETVDIVDESGKPIFDMYVEIYNKDDPFSIVCKKVEGNTVPIVLQNGVRKRFKYTEVYIKAFAKYKERKETKNSEYSKISENQKEIERLNLELEKLKKETENKNSKNKTKTENKVEVKEQINETSIILE